MRTHDQTKDRHEIMVPLMLNKATLRLVIDGDYRDEEEIEHFVDHILREGQVTMNPSDSLGDGASIAEIFSLGLMCFLKDHKDVDVNPAELWWHPCSMRTPKRVVNIEIEYEDVRVLDPAPVLYAAIDTRTGETVTADEVGADRLGARSALDELAEDIGMPRPTSCSEGDAVLRRAAELAEEEVAEVEAQEDLVIATLAMHPLFSDPNNLHSWVKIKGAYHLLFEWDNAPKGSPTSTVFPAGVLEHMFAPEQLDLIGEYDSLSHALSDRDLPF